MSCCKQVEVKRRDEGETADISSLSASSLCEDHSTMQIWRGKWEPCLPQILRSPVEIEEVSTLEGMGKMERSDVSAYFPLTSGNSLVRFVPSSDGGCCWRKFPARRVGVVLSGGQASGGHNVIAGLMSYIKLCNPSSQLFGFLGGPEGVYTGRYRELTEKDVEAIFNQGGFNAICSGRHKIETEEQMRASLEICEKLMLHGLVVVGGDDSNTNAAILAEYFKRNSSGTVVVGCPKTIDGDLKNEIIETSFGYDTAVKTYCEQIGSIMEAVRSERDKYYFVRLMGRSASHITLECGLQTRANMILIGEEIKEENRSLMSIVDELVNMMVARYSSGKRHGVVLLPEGLIEFIPEFEVLIKELNQILLETSDRRQVIESLSPEMKTLFLELPSDVQNQLLLERDPHGNVQVAKIATEELLVHMARTRLEQIGKAHILDNVRTHYFGYEGRCALPSNFDSSYCFALGHTAAALIDNKRSGYMAVVRRLSLSPEKWEPAGCPLTYMMNIELRKGKSVPVIKKYLVDLRGESYLAYRQVRSEWNLNDYYRNPGPIQFDGPCSGATNYMISPPRVEDLLRTEDRRCQEKNFTVVPASDSSRDGAKDGMRVPQILLSKTSKFEGVSPVSLSCKDLQASVVVASGCQSHQKEKSYKGVLQLRDCATFPCCKDGNALCQNSFPTNSSFSGESLGLILSHPSAPGAQNVICGLVKGLPSVKQLIVFKSFSDFCQGKALKVEMTSEDSLNFFESSLNSGGYRFPNAVPVSMHSFSNGKQSSQCANNQCSLSCTGAPCNDVLAFFNIKALAVCGDKEAAMIGAKLAEESVCMSSCGTRNEIPVVFIPVCLENSISHHMVEACVGFDSVTKSIATLVGNLLTDSASATKYWYFMKTIGEKTSNVALEVGVQTHPNLVVIPERYSEDDCDCVQVALSKIISQISDVICLRSSKGNNFGGLVVSEGLFDQVYPTRQYRRMFSNLRAKDLNAESKLEVAQEVIIGSDGLSKYEKKVLEDFKCIFGDIDAKLVENLVTTSRISDVQTEVILSSLVQRELKRRKSAGQINVGMNPVCFSFTDQVRACFPSDFDASLGFAYGLLASKIISNNLVGGYVTGIKGVLDRADNWNMYAVPISSLMTLELEGRQDAACCCLEIPPCASTPFKAKSQCEELLCGLKSVNSSSRNPLFGLLMDHIGRWEVENVYANPGPIQFYNAFKHLLNRTLFESEYTYTQNLREISQIILEIKTSCQLGVEKDVLNSTIQYLRALQNSISIINNSCQRITKSKLTKCIQECNTSKYHCSNCNNTQNTNPEMVLDHIICPETCN